MSWKDPDVVPGTSVPSTRLRELSVMVEVICVTFYGETGVTAELCLMRYRDMRGWAVRPPGRGVTCPDPPAGHCGWLDHRRRGCWAAMREGPHDGSLMSPRGRCGACAGRLARCRRERRAPGPRVQEGWRWRGAVRTAGVHRRAACGRQHRPRAKPAPARSKTGTW